MNSAPILTIAYLERLPESSARVIAGMSPQDAAAFLETLPTRVVAPIVEKMEKWPAARCMQYMSAEAAAALLSEISYQDAAVLLRLTLTERRNVVLEQLPTRLARDLRGSLRYPRNCVGAWMDVSVPRLSLNATVKDAVAVAKTGQAGDAIFIVDDGQRVAGLVRMDALLRHAATTRLADIVQTGIKSIFSRALLREVASDPGWDAHLRLPVANRSDQLVGVLSRHDLLDGLTTIDARSETVDTEMPLWAQVGEAFATSLAGLVRLFDGDDARQHTENRHGR